MKSGIKPNKKKAKQLTLPDDFESRVEEYESKYKNEDTKMENILTLLELYSLAMEFYTSNNDAHLYSIYQAKNSAFLEDPHVLKTLEEPYRVLEPNNHDETIKAEQILLRPSASRSSFHIDSKKEHVS